MSLLETKGWVRDWLWSSEKRTTVNREWDNQYITDAAQMIEDHLPDTRKLIEAQVKLATMRELLEETRGFHLRFEADRDWLARRESALAIPLQT